MLLAAKDGAALAAIAAGMGDRHDVIIATTRARAIDEILLAERLDFVVVGRELEDGTGIEVARTATLTLPTPHVLVIAQDWTVEEAFILGTLGVHGTIPAPLEAEALLEAMGTVERAAPPSIYALMARYVGRVSLLALESEVRRAVLMQALDRTGGSRSAAARLLGISRQMVQKVANSE